MGAEMSRVLPSESFNDSMFTFVIGPDKVAVPVHQDVLLSKTAKQKAKKLEIVSQKKASDDCDKEDVSDGVGDKGGKDERHNEGNANQAAMMLSPLKEIMTVCDFPVQGGWPSLKFSTEYPLHRRTREESYNRGLRSRNFPALLGVVLFWHVSPCATLFGEQT